MAKTEEVNKEKRSDLFAVDPRNIMANPNFNVRIDYGDIEQLEEQIMSGGGIKNPVRIYPAMDSNGKRIADKYFLTDGYRRHKAAMNIYDKYGKIVMMPAIKESRGYKDEDRFIDMVLLNDGKPLTPIEEAEAYRRLLELGHTEGHIVDKVGKSAAHVNNLIKLINAPEEIKNLVHKGTISATLAVDVLRKYKGEDAVKIIQEAQENMDDTAPIRGRAQGKVTKKMIEHAQNVRDGEDGVQEEEKDTWEDSENDPPSHKTDTPLRTLNSVREVKDFAKTVDEEDVPDDLLEVYALIVGIANNEIRQSDLKKYFKISG